MLLILLLNFEAAEEDLRHALQSHGQVVGLAELGLDFGGIASVNVFLLINNS
jgi:hypothetical protein